MTMYCCRPSLTALLILSVFVDLSTSDCSRVPDTLSVREDKPLGSVLTTVNSKTFTIDRCQENAVYNQQILSVLSSQNNWNVQIMKMFDAETMPIALSYDVTCVDLNGATSKTVITIQIEDVDEFAPKFNNQLYNISVREDTSNQTSIFKFIGLAEDQDRDKSHTTIQFVLISDGNKTFAIQDHYQGEVLVVQELDYDSGHIVYELNVSASEYINQSMANFTTLRVNVLDVDDLNPVFDQEVYSLQIPEGTYSSAPYQPSPKLSAYDGDKAINETIYFGLDISSKALYNNLFDVDKTGQLLINGIVKPGKYNINIRAYQADKPMLRFAVAVLVLTVTDVNDNQPVMSSSQYIANISEMAAVGTTVLIVSARDSDEGDNSLLQFFMQGNTNSAFNLVTDGTVGYVVVNGSLDREVMASYTFQVYAKETKTKELFESQHSNVTINVLDENDHSPVFTIVPYSFSINRTATGLIGQVSATDEDAGSNGQIIYSLLPSSFSSALTLDPNTGEITLVKNLVPADVGSHYLLIKATDNCTDVNKRLSSVAAVVVQVLPVNDHIPTFIGQDPLVFNLFEITLANTLIGLVSALDVDGDALVYSIKSGNINNYVRLDPLTGQLNLAKVNDLDTASPPTTDLTLTLAASDGLHESNKIVLIHFSYVNEFDPVISPILDVSLKENSTPGAIIATAVAKDDDKGLDGEIVYSLLPLPLTSNFAIDPKTGVITLVCEKCLNYEQKNSYDIVVQVQDRGQPPRSALTSFTINITQTTFAKPHFSKRNYHFQVLENSENYFELDATDPDTQRDLLVFSQITPFQASDVGAIKIIVLHNGTVIVSFVDAETLSSLSCRVSVTDGVNVDNATIVVTVTDVNDNDPVLKVQSPVNIRENFQPGDVVLSLSAIDLDISNVNFIYIIVKGADGKFQVNSSSGAITTTGQFDRRLKSQYNLTLTVLDDGLPRRSDSKYLVINVVDSNTAPMFVNDTNTKQPVAGYTFHVVENTPPGSVVGSVYGFDPDSGSSGQLSYAIVSQGVDQVFLLDSTNGQLSLKKILNFEVKSSYNVMVTVTDNSYEPKSSTAEVTVIVTNVVEAPEWPHPLPVIYFMQTSSCSPLVHAVSQELTTLTIQGDEGVDYQLTNRTNEFQINSSTGSLQVIKILSPGTYVVGLTACATGTAVCANTSLTVVVSTGDILTFCPAYVIISVNESTYNNHLLQDLDTNKGDAGIVYSITSDNLFWINHQDGKLYVNGTLDREIIQQYILIVTAKETSTTETASSQIIIYVLDLPDTPPVFLLIQYSGEVSESANIGDAVTLPESAIPLYVKAEDNDLNPKLSYSLISSLDMSTGSFHVDPTTGAITLAKRVDFDTMPENLNKTFRFEVQVTDGVYNNATLVIVKILDANDNAPEFDNYTAQFFEVKENVKPPIVVYAVTATDRDSLDVGKLQYSLTLNSPTNKGNPFKIEALTGNIILEDQLDRETVPEYSINVTVTDLAGHWSTKQVKVVVTDDNDNRPYFVNTTYYMNVTEDRGLLISVTPREIIVGKTPSLLVNCSFSHPPPITAHLVSLVLYASTAGSPFKEILSANTYTPETVAHYVDLHSAFVYKVISANVSRVSYIAIQWMYPGYQGDTVYKCEANTLDIHDMPESFTTGLQVVRRGQSTLEDLLTELQLLGNIVFTMTTNGSCVQEGHCQTNWLKEENDQYRQLLYYISDPFESIMYYMYKVKGCEISETSASKASTLCGMMGGQLTRIENPRQYAYIRNFLRMKVNNETSVYISGHDEALSDHWVYYETRDALEFYDWAPEQNGVGTSITIEAVDKDSDTNADVSFKIISGDYGHFFKTFNLNKNKAVIQTIAPFDREVLVRNKTTTFQLLISSHETQDFYDYPSSSTCTVLVTIIDINDNSPSFGSDLYTGNIYETAALNTTIILSPPLVVTDEDSGENGPDGIVFFLASSDLFSIDRHSGQLYLSGNSLDRETQGIFHFQINATDQLGKGLSSTANVTVTVLDVNDEKPEFDQLSYIFNVSENVIVSTVVGRLRTTDKDGGKTLYFLDGSHLFTISPQEGDILVIGNLIRKDSSVYYLNASACDVQLQQSPCSYVNVTIQVLDFNDHCPVWNMSSLRILVTESQGVSSVVGQIMAVDEDDGSNGRVTYFTNDTDVNSTFNVTETGNIVLLHAIENSRTFKFHVYAKDGGSPKCVQEEELIIDVIGVNKCDPVLCYNSTCRPNTVNLSVASDSRAGSVIGYVTSFDNDTGINGQTHYYLDNTSYIYITKGGFIVLQKDSSNIQMPYSVTLWVIDLGINPRNSSTTLTLTLQTSNNHRPVFDNISYNFSVPENSAFQGKINATSPNGKQLKFYVVSIDPVPFNISNDGTVFNTSNLDREMDDRYEFIVSASIIDDPAMFTWSLVLVDITDVNDNAPVFDISHLFVSVTENINQSLAAVQATDKDAGLNGQIKYSLIDNFTHFSVDSKTGELSVVMSLDREVQRSYILYVVAQDGGTPVLSSTATVEVTVTDVNDNAPVFDPKDQTFSITHSESVPQTLYALTATDPDEGINQIIIYTLEENTEDSKFFTIDFTTGVLSTIQKLTKAHFRFQVRASDLGTPPLHSVSTVTVNVELQEVIPTLSVTPDTVALYVGMSSGTDLGVTVNYFNAVNLTLKGGDDMFRLMDRKIVLTSKLLEAKDFTLVITASNWPVSQQNVSKNLQVSVKNLEFDQKNYLASVPENDKSIPKVICQLGTPAKQITSVNYQLHNFLDFFKLDLTNGTLWVIKQLDRESTAVYILNVSVAIASTGPSQARQKRQIGNSGFGFSSIIVQVLDLNDNCPMFANDGSILYFNVPTFVTNETVIATIQAFDPDEGLNGIIAYTLLASQSVFQLDSQNGALKVIDSLTLSSRQQWDLRIGATDRNGTGNTTFINVNIYVQNMSSYTLPASIPLSLFTAKENEIMRRLGDLLGLTLSLTKSVGISESSTAITFKAVDPRTNASVSTNDISRKVEDKLADIADLLNSYQKTVKASSSTEDGGFNTISIVLIVIGCVMFFASLVAILIAYLLWKKQKHYTQKEENAARVREKLSEQKVHKSSNASSDPDQDLEMNERKRDLEEQESTFTFETEFNSEISTMALRQHLLDLKTHKMQHLFQSISEEDSQPDESSSSHSQAQTQERSKGGSPLRGRSEVIHKEADNDVSDHSTSADNKKQKEDEENKSQPIYSEISHKEDVKIPNQKVSSTDGQVSSEDQLAADVKDNTNTTHIHSTSNIGFVNQLCTIDDESTSDEEMTYF